MINKNIYTIYKCKDGRSRVYDKSTKRVTSYPRLLLENKLKRKLNPTEQVHHIDGNKRNNKLSNLTVLNIKEHQKLHCAPQVESQCYLCGNKITLVGKRLSRRKSDMKRGKKGPFCSKRCSGLYGAAMQNNRKI